MSASDVKVWDAPSIGRNDGMSVETKCYQHVVIWADYAKALMKVEDERDEANRVCEQWRQWTVAARADNEALRARVAEADALLKRIAADWPTLECEHVHHGKADRHGDAVACPVLRRWDAVGIDLNAWLAGAAGNKPPQCFSTEGDDRR